MMSGRDSPHTRYGRQSPSARIQTSCLTTRGHDWVRSQSHIVTLRTAEARGAECVPHSPKVDYLLQKRSSNRRKVASGGNDHPTDTQGHATNSALKGDSPHVRADMKELVDLA